MVLRNKFFWGPYFSTFYAAIQPEFSTPHPGPKAILGHWHTPLTGTHQTGTLTQSTNLTSPATSPVRSAAASGPFAGWSPLSGCPCSRVRCVPDLCRHVHTSAPSRSACKGRFRQAGPARDPTSMSDNRPLAVSLSSGAGVSLLEVHFDDRCSVGMDPLVDLDEETLERPSPVVDRPTVFTRLRALNVRSASQPVSVSVERSFSSTSMFECVSGLHRFSASRAELGYRRLSPPPSGRARTRATTPDTSGTEGRLHMSRQQKNRPHFSQSWWNHQQVLARIVIRKSARQLTGDGIHDGKEDVEPVSVMLLCVFRWRVSSLCLPFACTRRCHRYIQVAARMITSEGGNMF